MEIDAVNVGRHRSFRGKPSFVDDKINEKSSFGKVRPMRFLCFDGNNVTKTIFSLKMISSPYCAVSEPNVYKHYKRLTLWNANRCYSLRITYLIFETFQILFPTASLIFTAVKVLIK